MKNRKISSRFMLIMIIAATIYTGLMIYVYIFNNKQESIILNDSRMQLTNVAGSLIKLRLNTARQTTNDYTYWDEFVTALQQSDTTWFANNISTILKSYHTDYVCVFDTGFRLVYEVAANGFVSENFIRPEVLQKLHRTRFLEYFDITTDGLLEISGATLHPELDPGHMLTRPRGFLFIVKKWDSNFLGELSMLSGTQVEMVTPEDSIKPVYSHQITTVQNLADWNGRTAAKLVFTRTSKALEAYNSLTIDMLMVMLVAMMVMAIILQAAIVNWINKPLKLIMNILKTGNKNKVEQLQQGPGEFRDIGNLLHDFMLQKVELKNAKEQAEESDRLKTAFVANMSHEIRTPMNGILGFANLLKEEGFSEEERLGFVDIIQESGNRLLNIINDLIEISKIESGQMDVILSTTNVNDQVEFIRNFFKPEVEAKGMQIYQKLPLPAEEATITTDREKLYAILTNLVKNAIKYSMSGFIVVGYEKRDDFLQFFVKDTGVGIPVEKQEAIFNRFIQAENAEKSSLYGVGLGLSIAKAYVEMLGGKIRVESEIGDGSVFYFTIPYKS